MPDKDDRKLRADIGDKIFDATQAPGRAGNRIGLALAKALPKPSPAVKGAAQRAMHSYARVVSPGEAEPEAPRDIKSFVRTDGSAGGEHAITAYTEDQIADIKRALARAAANGSQK